jgi:O-antigen ligase/tetratricopeptide (TPR) repeat protein
MSRFPPALASPPATPALLRCARWVLALHLLLSPLVFCTWTAEAFEENKAALLRLTALLLTALGGARLLQPPVESFSLRRWWRRLGPDPVLAGALLFTLSAVVSTACSISPHTSWRGAAESHAGLRTALGYLVVFVATRALCPRVEDGWRLLTAPVLATAAVTAYALVQLAGHDPLAWDVLSVYAGHIRPFSTLGHPNFLAGYLVLTLPLAAAFAGRALSRRRWLSCLSLAVLGLAAGFVVLAALSRAAWLAAGCSAVLLLLGWRAAGLRRPALVAGLAVALVGAACLIGWRGAHLSGAALLERVRGLPEGAGRWQIWQAAWKTFRARPASGCGLDGFRLAFGAHRPADYVEMEWNATPTRAHNEVLHILATQGLLGAAGVLVLGAGVGCAAARSWGRADVEDRPLLAALVAGVAGFAVLGMFGFTVVGVGALFVTAAALLSRWSAVSRSGEPSRTSASSAAARHLPRWRRRAWWAVLGATAAGVLMEVVLPVLGSAACRRGDVLLGTDPESALACYEWATFLDRGCDRHWVRLSGAAQQAARLCAPEQCPALLGRARAALERARDLVSADPYHHANLGRLLGEMARRGLASPREAHAEWDVALAADPANPTFLAESARTALLLGDPARARRHARRALELYPRFAQARARLAACALADGRPAEAEGHLAAALAGDWHGDQDGRCAALASLAVARLHLRRFAPAEAVARQALAARPDWPDAHLLLAQALHGQGRLPEARQAYSQVLLLAPDHPLASRALRQLASHPPPLIPFAPPSCP